MPSFPPSRQADAPLLGMGVFVRVSQFVSWRPLRDLAEPGCEQGGVEGTHPRPRTGIDDQVGQRIEIAHRVDVTHLKPFDALGFALSVWITPPSRVSCS